MAVDREDNDGVRLHGETFRRRDSQVQSTTSPLAGIICCSKSLVSHLIDSRGTSSEGQQTAAYGSTVVELKLV